MDMPGARRAQFFADQRGFSLIELVVSTLLLGIIATVVATALSAGMKSYFTTDFRKEALDQARVAMERMTREIRNLKNSASVTASTATQFSFVDVDGNTVAFAAAALDITRNGSSLATNVASCTFGYVRASGATDAAFSAANTKRIRITIVATVNAQSVTLQSEVWPRNL